MGPRYFTSSATGSGAWQLVNWTKTPQQMSFAILSTGGSSGTIDVTLEDPTLTFPNPNSSTPTAFSSLFALTTGQTNVYFGGMTSSMGPVAAYRLTLNTAGAKVTLVSFQVDVG